MPDPDEAGRELLALLYESLRDTHDTLFELGFKVKALEGTVRSFGNTRNLYESTLAEVRTPEALRAKELQRSVYESQIQAIRAGRFPQD
jgi:hypothetical protein